MDAAAARGFVYGRRFGWTHWSRVGAIAGIVGSTLTAWHQLRAERQRARAARLDDLIKAERTALLDLTQLLATGTQAIAWLAWAANVLPADQVRQEINSYDGRMRELLASEVAAANLSDHAFERIDPLVRELITLGTTVSTAAAPVRRQRR